MADFDPFDTPINNEDSPRGPGRPRTRQIREKGSVGRPRVRPINDPSSRRRGRPSVTPGSVADSIATETIISGQMTAKAINASVQGLQGAIGAFQKGVVSPLATQVTAFSQAINRFNKSHQEYLKEQIAVSREIHETYRLIRKVGLDPLIRNTERTRLAISSVTDVMKQINKEKYQGKEYEQMISSLTSMDRKLNRMVTAGVVGTEATDTFLREYYRTSKGTSKFLNAVTFAAEDIAEDIQTLKTDLNKYFKGKNSSKTILQDNSESLKKIEKNTKGIGFVVASSVLSGIAALTKTAFLFNRYGTTDAITTMLGIKKSKGASSLSKSQPFSKMFSAMLGVETPTKFQEASLGGYGDFAKGMTESFERTSRNIRNGLKDLRGLGKSIADAWDDSKVKWFWDIGLKMFADKWDQSGAIGVSIVSKVKSAYGRKNYKGPHPSNRNYWGTQEETYAGMQKAFDKFNRSKSRLSELGDWESENEAAVEFTPEQLRMTMSPRKRSLNNIIDATAGFRRVRRNSQSKIEARVDAAMGKGAKVVSINPKSTNQISSADVSTPRKAWGSLTKIQGRILGVLQRLEKHIKGIDKNTEDLDELGGSEKGGLGGLGKALGMGGLAAFLMRNRKLLKGKKGGLSLLGKLVFGGRSLARGFKGLPGKGSLKGLAGLGAGARVYWDALGWGSSKLGNGAMDAVGLFKHTKLGRSFIGRALRQARVAAAGYGTGLGSRLLGALSHSRKWGGGILGNTIGAYKGFVAPRRSIEGFAKLANPTRGMSLLQKGGLMMDKAGASIISGFNASKGAVSEAATKAGNWLGGMSKVPKGSILAKIPSKDKLIGGLIGGAGLKLLGKTGGKGIAKILAKQIPFLGALVGIGFGVHRFTKGDVLGGILEIVSGLLTLVPTGATNAAALGIDTFLIGRDLHKANKVKEQKDLKEEKVKKEVLNYFGVNPNVNKDQAKPVESASVTPSTASPTNSVGNTIDPTAPGNTAPAANKEGGILVGLKNAAHAVAGKFNQAISGISPAANNSPQGAEVTNINNVNPSNTPAINWNGTNTQGLMPEFVQKLNTAANNYYKATGKKIKINSAVRTNRQQAVLWVKKNVFNDPHIYSPRKPLKNEIVSVKGQQFFVRGSNPTATQTTGHMAGGAIDVDQNIANQFYPYAEKEGLIWGGRWRGRSNDPVHFQFSKPGPIVGASSNITTPPANAKIVGDGANESGSTGITPMKSSNSIGNSAPASANPSSSTEISPMIQDYGLAIINNLLFA